jgi:hypothetical protein
MCGGAGAGTRWGRGPGGRSARVRQIERPVSGGARREDAQVEPVGAVTPPPLPVLGGVTVVAGVVVAGVAVAGGGVVVEPLFGTVLPPPPVTDGPFAAVDCVASPPVVVAPVCCEVVAPVWLAGAVELAVVSVAVEPAVPEEPEEPEGPEEAEEPVEDVAPLEEDAMPGRPCARFSKTVIAFSMNVFQICAGNVPP